MADQSRSRNVGKNVVVGFAAQIVILLLSFIGRTIFVKYLGVDYLGINGLYSNVLSVLSLAELGIGNVMAFSLYKPIADKNKDTIAVLLHYFRKLYGYIAISITVIGLLTIPFLKYIIQSELNQQELIIFYIIFLLNSAISYNVAHKTACITAHQELYVIKKINVITSIIVHILQIAVLIIFRNYYTYLLVLLFNTLLSNYLIGRAANTRYPYIMNKKNVKATITRDLIDLIEKNVKATFIYKVGTTIVNSTDNILISAMIGTTWVGYYSNYYMVVKAVQEYLGIIITSLIPSIGNLNSEGNADKSREVFFILIFLFHWSAAFGGISFYLLFGDLIPIWLGSEYVLEPLVTFAIAFNFYIINAVNPVWMYRETMGLFTKVKYLMLGTAILNLLFSIILGRLMGLAGILLATAIARIMTIVCYEPKILFQMRLGGGLRRYWGTQFKYLGLTIISFAACYWLSMLFPHSLIGMVAKGFIFFMVTIIVFIAGAFRTRELSKLVDQTKYFIARMRKRSLNM